MDKRLYEISPAKKEDVSAIAAIEQICFPEAWNENMILSAMDGGTTYLAAYDNGRCIGYAAAAIVVGEGQVANIAVHPDYRSKGLGRSLTAALVDFCFAAGCDCLTLEVRHTNTIARRLYLSLGFEEVGLRRNYYSNPTADAVLMTLNKGGEQNG